MVFRIYRFRYFLLVLLGVACLFLWPGFKRALEVDNSLKVWFLKDDPALLAYEAFQDRFGNDEVIIVFLKEEQSLLTPDYFRAFTRLTDSLQALEEVQEVISAASVQVPVKGAFGGGMAPLLQEHSSPASVLKSLEANPYLQKQLFTDDFTGARFLVVLKNLPDFDARRGEILEKVQARVAEQLPAEKTFFGGVGVIYAGLNSLSKQDFAVFLGLGYTVMFLLMLYLYRDVWDLLYALATIVSSTYLTLGVYGTLGFRLNIMTTVIPTIIILLGILDVVHVINERNNQHFAHGHCPKQLALNALSKVFKPCLFTTLTTVAGFLALLSSPMAILKTFGIFSALGISLSLVFTYLFGVIFLPISTPSVKITEKTRIILGRFLEYISKRRPLFAGISMLFLLLSIAGISRLKTDTDTIGYLPDDHAVVRDHEAIEQGWGPYMPLEVIVEPDSGRKLYSPEVVQAALAFADSVQKVDDVGEVFGFSSLYKAGLMTMYGDKWERMLQYKGGLLQVDKQLRSMHPRLFQQYIHDSTGSGRITISGKMMSAASLNEKMADLLQVSEATLGKVATVTPAGYQPMYAGIVNYATRSQVSSLALALVMIFFLVWIFIRSFRLAVISVIPNFFPILLMLGTMGWFNIHLDVATASIAAIVLSFSIDDTIHFIYGYQRYRLAGSSPREARAATVTHIGPAIVLTSLILFFGYVLMVFASLKTVMLFGLLTALAIMASLYSHLVIFPVLLVRFDKQKSKNKVVPAGTVVEKKA